MTITEYRKKRHFNVTPEPSGPEPEARESSPKTPAKPAAKAAAKPAAARKPAWSLRYVIQKHRASQLHYDFRLEWNGVLLSWAVPKGPSLDPAVKRLAMQVEDHPVDYADFEGVIPEGEYGGGTVMVWDTGTWFPDDPEVDASLLKGDLKFSLQGAKLKGSWVLVRTHGYGNRSKSSWLLIKHRDRYASTEDIAARKPQSAASNRLLADIAREGGGDVAKAATGDPAPRPQRVPAARHPRSAAPRRAKKTARTSPAKAASEHRQ